METCFIPDFIDYKRENVIKTTDGCEAVLEDVHLTFFESEHSADGNIVHEYGFSLLEIYNTVSEV